MRLQERRALESTRRRRFGCWHVVAAFIAAGLIGLTMLLWPQTLPEAQQLPRATTPSPQARLRPVTAFDGIADTDARSVALFAEAGRVIQHPRCLNCHPRTDRPTQTEAMRPHSPWVVRGPDGQGDDALRCETCHQPANYDPAGVPGNPMWALAPAGMAWQGRSLGEICRQIQDPARGGMAHAELLRHMATDELVAWAWLPGGDRTPAPGTQARFGELIAAWIESGARCPA